MNDEKKTFIYIYLAISSFGIILITNSFLTSMIIVPNVYTPYIPQLPIFMLYLPLLIFVIDGIIVFSINFDFRILTPNGRLTIKSEKIEEEKTYFRNRKSELRYWKIGLADGWLIKQLKDNPDITNLSDTVSKWRLECEEILVDPNPEERHVTLWDGVTFKHVITADEGELYPSSTHETEVVMV